MACLIPKSRIVQKMAVLFASVPPLVKNISEGEVFSSLATVLRDSFRANGCLF